METCLTRIGKEMAGTLPPLVDTAISGRRRTCYGVFVTAGATPGMVARPQTGITELLFKKK